MASHKIEEVKVTSDATIPDFIIVVKKENLDKITVYLDNLKEMGLAFENAAGMSIDLIFIKVAISDEMLYHYSELYDIGNEDPSVTAGFYKEPVFGTLFKTAIDETIPFLKGEITDAEKIMIVDTVLQRAKFGKSDKEFGLSELIKLKYIETAYPLHDGEITEDGTNKRSLLYRYWSNTAVTHMRQPLDLIYRYFGNEVAFYFAWLEYFNLMLIVPAILGTVTFLLSMVYLIYGRPPEVMEICTASSMFSCPVCVGKQGCKFKTLNKSCSLAQWTFVFDNQLTVQYGILVSFWTTLFMTFWIRKENKLKFRWNCVNDVRTSKIRQAFLEKATVKEYNPISGEIEASIPKVRNFLSYSLTVTISGILVTYTSKQNYNIDFQVGVSVLLAVGIMFSNIYIARFCESSGSMYLKSQSKLLPMVLGSGLTLLAIRYTQKFYGPLALQLTRIENPKTQFDFDNSVLYKKYLFAFMNNYIYPFYAAFIKGQFVTVPHKMTFMRRDTCHPCNCTMGLAIKLSFLMTIKTLVGNIYGVVAPMIWKSLVALLTYCKRSKKSKQNLPHVVSKNLPQWETEYYLDTLGRYSVTTEFSEMVIRYGFIAFFSKAFPLASICTLLNNLIEIRSDAYKFVSTHRRQVPLRNSGIGAWNGILRGLAYLSTVVNGFVIAFTSDWVAKEVFRGERGTRSLVGYINSTLTTYDTSDNPAYKDIPDIPRVCYFRAYLRSNDDFVKYGIPRRYYINLTFKLVSVLVFEHIMFLCTSVFAYCIPYKPESVQLQLDLFRHKEKETLVTECEEKLENKMNHLQLGQL